jgi:1,4-alpha-glucan branching enzyme
VHYQYEVGVPSLGSWKEIFNSDAEEYGGSNVSSGSLQEAVEKNIHHQDYSISLTLPPLSVIYWSKE